MELDNKSDMQIYFNHVKGKLINIDKGEKFGSVTIEAGHEKKRFINITFSVDKYDQIIGASSINDKVCVKYYPSSYNKFGKWKSILHLLEIKKIVTIV